MSKFLLSLFALVLFSACIKAKDTGCHYDECAVVAPAGEISNVQTYLASVGITDAIQHCSGGFYRIISQGTGAQPNACNSVNATYGGYLTNGNRFDTGTATFPLKDVIRGWTNLMPQLKAGGKIQMILPPTLAYGASATGSIPANSILVFNVTLNSVQ
jgi:FKBP-type peptidyl-prolyl cis-trans isomerase FkpA